MGRIGISLVTEFATTLGLLRSPSNARVRSFFRRQPHRDAVHPSEFPRARLPRGQFELTQASATGCRFIGENEGILARDSVRKSRFVDIFTLDVLVTSLSLARFIFTGFSLAGRPFCGSKSELRLAPAENFNILVPGHPSACST